MRLLLATGFFLIGLHVQAQNFTSINEQEVTRIEKTLASDDMMGRKVFTSGIEKAADFIEKEFSEAGLKPLPGAKDFRQSFTMVEPEITESAITMDGAVLNSKDLIVFSAEKELVVKPESHYLKLIVKNSADFGNTIFKYMDSKENVIVLVDTSLAKRFNRFANFHMPQFEGSGTRIFVLTASDPKQFEIRIKQNIKSQHLTNIVGIIPGKSKPEEYVIFSAHYDHLGIGKSDLKGDSVFNGANDDASGTTAVITLSKYFSKMNNNERTLVFVTFTAEEIGEFGSAYFSKQMDPAKVMAMFNIEMIGTESKWGFNSAYITGFDKSDMGGILQKNLANSQFRFYPDPYPEQQLFLRSDNATLAKLGVPSHTISTSKMDSEKFYHKQGDEIQTLDMKNMTEIIRAIGLSAGSIISGKDTPTRVTMN